MPTAPSVFTIPPHRAFSDALAAGLMAAHGSDPLALARGTILLPNNRAVRAVTAPVLKTFSRSMSTSSTSARSTSSTTGSPTCSSPRVSSRRSVTTSMVTERRSRVLANIPSTRSLGRAASRSDWCASGTRRRGTFAST